MGGKRKSGGGGGAKPKVLKPDLDGRFAHVQKVIDWSLG